MHKHFDVPPFNVHVSSHGVLTVKAADVPAGGKDDPLPGVLLAGTTDLLNETWDSEGREPLELLPGDDGMPPDLNDPRLDRCVRRFVENHRKQLERNNELARQKWAQMQDRSYVIEGTEYKTGDRVRLFYKKPPRSDWLDEGEYTVLAATDQAAFVGRDNRVRGVTLNIGVYRIVPVK